MFSPFSRRGKTPRLSKDNSCCLAALQGEGRRGSCYVSDVHKMHLRSTKLSPTLETYKAILNCWLAS